MPDTVHPSSAPAAIRIHLGAIFVSLELSKSIWLVTALSPGSEKMARHSVPGGDLAALLQCFGKLREKAEKREGQLYPVVVIQEAGLDGFWIHRALEAEAWITSHVVDAASIAVSRRHRRAKTDRVDGEMLIRALMAHIRGEPRVCSMVRVPSLADEDQRLIGREREILVAERIQHTNRIKGLCFNVGIRDYKPLHRDRRQRLEDLCTGDGQPLPRHLKAQISRELDRLELLIAQIKAIEAERDALMEQAKENDPRTLLWALNGIGPEFANVLANEGLFRDFNNRRQVAAYAGLAASPWKSGSIDHEQGVSKSGNPRLRKTMVQLSWLWLRYQPDSQLACWFQQRVSQNGGRGKKVAIIALARKLLVALWKFATRGVVIEGAVMSHA